MNFDFTKFELDYINENANFNKDQQEVFNRLTDENGRQSIVKMALEMKYSTSTISKIVKQVKTKILKIL